MTRSIRLAQLADAPGIAAVHVAGWRSAYRGIIPDEVLDGLSVEDRAQRWQNNLQGGGQSFTLVAEQDGQIVGFARGGQQRDLDYPTYDGEIYALYLLPEVQRQGMGRLLVQAASQRLYEQKFQRLLIWVLAANPARKFYEALGGKYLGEKQITLGIDLPEVAYGWDDLSIFLQQN